MARYPKFLAGVLQPLQRVYKITRNLYQESPTVFAVVLTILLIIILTAVLVSMCFRRLLGSWGMVLVDVWLFWNLMRFVARIIMFPASMTLFQRNSEATVRIELARQYVHYLRQLWVFLQHAANQPTGSLPRGITADGVLRGYEIICHLNRSFEMQQQLHSVVLSEEQKLAHGVAQEVERWFAAARIKHPGARGGLGGPPAAGTALLVDWLRCQATGLLDRGTAAVHALSSVELLGVAEDAVAVVDKVRELVDIFDELRFQKKSMCANLCRFFRVPTIGSLNHLRAELQIRYGGHHCWVRTRGSHHLDAMFIPCGDGQGAAEENAQLESIPLRSADEARAFSGPTIVWCNPNAAYYEQMIYQASMLNFWLARGFNIFVFNYSGYGRSSGKPSPQRLAEDGDAVIKFLKAKGITQIGIYCRSIGGVSGCHMAHRHPDVVQLLVVDRSMSKVELTGKFLYGTWSMHALRIARMIYSNVDCYLEVRCYKLLIVDPKDSIVADPSSLRSAVALRIVERMVPEERFPADDERLRKLREVWHFLGRLFAICDPSDESDGGFELDSGRSARQPTILGHDPRADVRMKAAESGEQSNATRSLSGNSAGPSDIVGVQWLEDNAPLVRATMSVLADQVRSALDIVGEHLEGGGVNLNDVFVDFATDPHQALRAMLANLQVWGTVGDQREGGFLGGDARADESSASQAYGLAVRERDIELFLRKSDEYDHLPGTASNQRLAELAQVLAPESLSTYHRRLARARVAQVRREFRRRLLALQHAFAHSAAGDAQSERLFRSVQHHLAEVEGFVASLNRFFKRVDLSPACGQQGQQRDGLAADVTALSDSSDEKLLEAGADLRHDCAVPQPAIDHTMAGYIIHISCGHNGLMDDVDLRQLELHVRSAGFGMINDGGS